MQNKVDHGDRFRSEYFPNYFVRSQIMQTHYIPRYISMPLKKIKKQGFSKFETEVCPPRYCNTVMRKWKKCNVRKKDERHTSLTIHATLATPPTHKTNLSS